MQPTFITLDFDGTCAHYVDGNPAVSPVLLDGIAPLLERGLRWSLNTDRPPEHAIAFAEAVPDDLRPAALLLRQRDIFLLRDGAYEAHMEWNSAMAEVSRALWADLGPHVPTWEKQVDHRFVVLDRFVSDHGLAFMVAPEQSDALRTYLRELVAPWPDAAVSGNAEWSFVLHSSYSKGRVLQTAADLFGIEHESIIAVGDGYNDLSMLSGRVTPLVGCPANSCREVLEAVREAGGFVSKLPEAAGTLEVIRFYCRDLLAT